MGGGSKNVNMCIDTGYMYAVTSFWCRVHQKPTNKNLLCQRWCRRLVEPPPPSSLQKTSHGIAALGRESKLRTCCVAFACAYDQWLGLGLGKRRKKRVINWTCWHIDSFNTPIQPAWTPHAPCRSKMSAQWSQSERSFHSIRLAWSIT